MKRKRHQLNIQLLFVLVTMAEIVGTVFVAILLAGLLEHFLHTTVNVHPLVWLGLFSLSVGTVVAAVVNFFLLRPVKRLSKAMTRVAQGDFSIRMEENSRIAELQDSYESFNRMAEELQATEMLQTDFVSNVSHEFKTPINAIEGYATLLQGASSQEEQHQCTERILMNTRRLSTLVGNILLLSKVSNHAIPAPSAPFRLDEQIRQVIVLLEPNWTKKNVDFDVELEEITWNGPEGLMGHVWSNLLGNAIKFGPADGLIRMRLQKSENQYVFTIDDQGPGIPEQEQAHIFNRFYQLDSSHKQEGNGLGLALCQQIVSTCGGSIGVENLQKGGCRFTVTLPAEGAPGHVANV